MFTYPDATTETILGKRFYNFKSNLFPSITTVLGNSIDSADDWVTAWRLRVGDEQADLISGAAAARGTAVHSMLELRLKGARVELQSYDPAHVKIYNSLIPHLSRINKIYGQEVALASTSFEVAGRCDLVGEWNGSPAIVDFKTASRTKRLDKDHDYWLQTCFYALAHNEMYGTSISKLVILIGVKNGLPLIFTREIDSSLIERLAARTEVFYNRLEKELCQATTL